MEMALIIIFLKRNLKNEEGRAKKHAFVDILCKIGQNQDFCATIASFFRFHQNKKNWNGNLKHFQQLLIHTILPPLKLIFLVLVLIYFAFEGKPHRAK